MEYLDEAKEGPKLLPDDPAKRFKVRGGRARDRRPSLCSSPLTFAP
jgi:glutathione S-transferase